MGEDMAFINLGDLAKPFTVLIEKIFSAGGILYEPRRIRNNAAAKADGIKMIAHAKADAALTEASAKIEITERIQRGMIRWVNEVDKQQENMEDIIQKSELYLQNDAHPEKIDDDWVVNLFDKSRLISDEEMQSLWAKVLAGEANSPGKFSKRAVNILSSMDKSDAELFYNLCSFCIVLGDKHTPILFDIDKPAYYKEKGINFETLNHLDNIGLIKFGEVLSYNVTSHSDFLPVRYFEQQLLFKFLNSANRTLNTGKLIMTAEGDQLASICGGAPVDGFFDNVIKDWKSAPDFIEIIPVQNQQASYED